MVSPLPNDTCSTEAATFDACEASFLSKPSCVQASMPSNNAMLSGHWKAGLWPLQNQAGKCYDQLQVAVYELDAEHQYTLP